MDRRNFVKLGTGLVAGLTPAASIATPVPAAPKQAANDPNAKPFRWELRDRFLHFQADWCEIPDWSMAIEVDRELLKTTSSQAKALSGQDPLRVEFHFPERQLVWQIHAEADRKANRLILRTVLRNESPKPIALGNAYLLQTERLGGFASPGDDVVYLPVASGQQINPVRKLETKSEWKTTLTMAAGDGAIAIQNYNQTQNKAFQAGFVTFLRNKTGVEELRQSGRLQVKAWCEFDGWELAPGASTPTETLILAVGEDPHRQLSAWADSAAALLPAPSRKWEELPHGWLGWSWVDGFSIEVYEDVVLRNAKAIRDRLAGFGVDYIWVSLGNIKDGQPGDWLNWNFKNFPNGPHYLHDQIEDRGLKWGLWCGAFMLSSKLQNKVEEFQGALFMQPDGKQPMIYTPAWAFGLDKPDEDYHKPLYALDPSHPKTTEFLTKVFATYRDWGVRYYMIDFLSAGADTLTAIPHAKHYDKSLVSGPEVFQKGLRAIRAACGDDTHLLAATGPTLHTATIMDAVRTGNDFCEGRALVAGTDTYPATFVIDKPDYWNGPVWALSNQASAYFTHRKLYINNSGNTLTVDKPVALNQAQVFATIHALSGGPSMLGDDLAIMDEERLDIIKKTLPRSQAVAFPVDLFTRKMEGCPQVFHRKIAGRCGAYDVLAIYNLDPERTLEPKVDLRSIGLDSDRSYLVWEFWNTEYIGKCRGQLRARVPAYSVRVYRLTEDAGRPTLLGTDMHVLMGEMEVDRCDWDAGQRMFSGRAIRPAGEEGSVFIYAPAKLGVANPKGYYLAQDKRDNSLIVRCPLRFDKGWAEWSVKFFDL